MKKIALDTNVFNFCYDRNIPMENLSSFFVEKELEPFVSPYVIYELARNFTINNHEKGKKLFLMLLELNPKYITRRDILYHFECGKLRANLDFDYEADAALLHAIENRIEGYSKGIVPHFSEDFISRRQLSLKERKQTWKPRGGRQSIAERFDNSFDCLIQNLFDLVLTEDLYRIDYIRKVILQATSDAINLSDNEIINLISNMSIYPALVTLIRLDAYLNFLVEVNEAVPPEDRFTDGLIMIEYSYCEIFLSGDNKLIDKHARNINPVIELKKPETYINIFEELV